MLSHFFLNLISRCVPSFDNYFTEFTLKVIYVTKKTWLYEVEQAPELLESIFHRCSTQNDFVNSLQMQGGLMNLSSLILNFLSFIKNYLKPFYTSENFYVCTNLVVWCDDDAIWLCCNSFKVHFLQFNLLQAPSSVRMLLLHTNTFWLRIININTVRKDTASPRLDFLIPLVDNCTWTHHQHWSMITFKTFLLPDLSGRLKACDESNGWKSFSQTHFISKNGPSIIQVWLQKPLECNNLMFH